MVNGTLSLHIPLISFPQRGGRLSMGISVVYNNPMYWLKNNRVNERCPLECYTWMMGTAANLYSGAGLAIAFSLQEQPAAQP